MSKASSTDAPMFARHLDLPPGSGHRRGRSARYVNTPNTLNAQKAAMTAPRRRVDGPSSRY